MNPTKVTQVGIHNPVKIKNGTPKLFASLTVSTAVENEQVMLDFVVQADSQEPAECTICYSIDGGKLSPCMMFMVAPGAYQALQFQGSIEVGVVGHHIIQYYALSRNEKEFSIDQGLISALQQEYLENGLDRAIKRVDLAQGRRSL